MAAWRWRSPNNLTNTNWFRNASSSTYFSTACTKVHQLINTCMLGLVSHTVGLKDWQLTCSLKGGLTERPGNIKNKQRGSPLSGVSFPPVLFPIPLSSPAITVFLRIAFLSISGIVESWFRLRWLFSDVRYEGLFMVPGNPLKPVPTNIMSYVTYSI